MRCRNAEIQICGVACARWETPYIREWISYCKAIGFDHVYLYCNDDDLKEFRDEIAVDQVHVDFVTLRHFIGQGLQTEMYRDAMQSVRAEAEWVAFLDIDEFLVLRGVNNVHDFMSRFASNVDSVYFNWAVFGDNGFLERPGGSVLKQYTRRSASLDPHTKHISRADKLTAEKLSACSFPFWHGLENPTWADLRRVNVLGEDWGHDVDLFPESAKRALADLDDAARILSVGAVYHYAFKSEADFLRRLQRGTAGAFKGQVKWGELYRSGKYKGYLAQINEAEDTYLQKYAETVGLKSAPAGEPAAHAPEGRKHVPYRTKAETNLWKAELELTPDTGRLLHCSHGSQGNYKEIANCLLVEWDLWPAEIFAKCGDVYKLIPLPTANLKTFDVRTTNSPGSDAPQWCS